MVESEILLSKLHTFLIIFFVLIRCFLCQIYNRVLAQQRRRPEKCKIVFALNWLCGYNLVWEHIYLWFKVSLWCGQTFLSRPIVVSRISNSRKYCSSKKSLVVPSFSCAYQRPVIEEEAVSQISSDTLWVLFFQFFSWKRFLSISRPNT